MREPGSEIPPGSPTSPLRQEPESRLKKALMPLGVLGLLLWKFKVFLIAALKFLPVLLKTGGSMFLMIWVYAMNWGWWYAAGFVFLILVHECGHLLAARRLGLNVGAPVFIPFMGAVIALKDAPRNAWVEAQVGIGGPILGSLGAAVCLVLKDLTGNPLFGALAYSGFLLNLFNLMPIGFLDGGRVVTALSPWLWVVGAGLTGLLMLAHFNFLLLLVPTIMMGATLPILVAYVVKSYKSVGVSIGLLYFVNTLGASFGAAATGLITFYFFGLSQTIYTAAALNAFVGLVVWFWLRRE